MNVLFSDGHVKSMKPLATISTTMGGSGSVNMWNRHAVDWQSGVDGETVYNGLILTALQNRDCQIPVAFGKNVFNSSYATREVRIHSQPEKKLP